MFAARSVCNKLYYEKVLLHISSIKNETTQSAQVHYEFLGFVPSVYNHCLSHVVALIGDSGSIKRVYVRLIKSIFVGCYVSCYSRGMKEFMHEQQIVLEKVQTLMWKLSCSIASAYLQWLTHFHFVLANKTKWSSTYHMLRRYNDLEHFVRVVPNLKIIDLLLTEEKKVELAPVLRSLVEPDFVTELI